MSLPMISPRHVSAATRGCLVWEDPDDDKQKSKTSRSHHHHHGHRHHHHGHHHRSSSSKANATTTETAADKKVASNSNNNNNSSTSNQEKTEKKHHRHHHHHHRREKDTDANNDKIITTALAEVNSSNGYKISHHNTNTHHSSPGRARVGPPPTLSLLHRAGGHEHDSNEGIKQSIYVERHPGGRITAFPAWGGAGGGYYSCFNYKGGKDARGRYDGAFDIIPTKDTQGRRRVNDHDTLAIGATASSFVPTEKPHGLRAVRPPQRDQPMDGQSGRGLHQDIGIFNVEKRPSRKRTCTEEFNWLKNQYNVMTEAQAPTDTRTNFQIIADAKRERNRQARRDFLAHLKSEGQYKAVNRVPIRSTLTQRRWDVDNSEADQQQQQQSSSGGAEMYYYEENNNSHKPTTASSYPHPPPMSAPSAAKEANNKHTVFSSLSPRARKYLGK